MQAGSETCKTDQLKQMINSWLLYNYYPYKGGHLHFGCFSAFRTFHGH